MLNKSKKFLNKKKKKISVSSGIIRCHFSQNNTISSFCRENGDVLFWCSAGKIGYKGTKKSTSYVAQKVIENVIQWLIDHEVKEVSLNLKKIGLGRDVVLKEVVRNAKIGNFVLKELIDSTPLKFGGTRPKKRPRK